MRAFITMHFLSANDQSKMASLYVKSSGFWLPQTFQTTCIPSIHSGSQLKRVIKDLDSLFFDLDLMKFIQTNNGERPEAVNHTVMKVKSRNKAKVKVIHLEHPKVVFLAPFGGQLRFVRKISLLTTRVQPNTYLWSHYERFLREMCTS